MSPRVAAVATQQPVSAFFLVLVFAVFSLLAPTVYADYNISASLLANNRLAFEAPISFAQGNSVYIIGGKSITGEVTNRAIVITLNDTTGETSVADYVTSNPPPRLAYAQTVVHPSSNRVLVFGGYNTTIYQDQAMYPMAFHQLDIASQTWEQPAIITRCMPPTRCTIPRRYDFTATLAADNNIYIFGGLSRVHNASTDDYLRLVLNDLWVYNTTTEEFIYLNDAISVDGTVGASLPYSRGHTAVALPNGKIIFMMGASAEDEVLVTDRQDPSPCESAWVFDIYNRSANLPIEQSTQKFVFNTLAVVDTETWQWKSHVEHGSPAKPRADFAAELLYGKYWVILGGYSESRVLNDLNVVEIPPLESTDQSNETLFQWLSNTGGEGVLAYNYLLAADDEAIGLSKGSLIGISVGFGVIGLLLMIPCFIFVASSGLRAVMDSVIGLFWRPRLNMTVHTPYFLSSRAENISCHLFSAPDDFTLADQIGTGNNGTRLKFWYVSPDGFSYNGSRVYISVYPRGMNPNKVVYLGQEEPHLDFDDVQRWLFMENNNLQTTNSYTAEYNTISSISYQLKTEETLVQSDAWNYVGFAEITRKVPAVDTTFQTSSPDAQVRAVNTLDLYPAAFLQVNDKESKITTFVSIIGPVSGLLSILLVFDALLFGTRPASPLGIVHSWTIGRLRRSLNRNLLTSYGDFGRPIPLVEPVNVPSHLLPPSSSAATRNAESSSGLHFSAKVGDEDERKRSVPLDNTRPVSFPPPPPPSSTYLVDPREISEMKRRLQLMENMFKAYYIDDEVFYRLYQAHREYSGPNASEDCSNGDIKPMADDIFPSTPTVGIRSTI
ncbi:hypothetical protein BX666DRAFT_1879350 [Dichotomocladium elegans]|nr:hypothetical protein BX666DRAFT_1879350 [Dichotomocladium elegans]